jgi:hypothetical protein
MPVKFTKEQTLMAVQFLRERPYMPHMAAAWALGLHGLSITQSGVYQIRKRYELKYAYDNKPANAVNNARSNGKRITEEYLKKKCPYICQEYIDYLLHFYANKDDRAINPVQVNTMAFYVQQLTANDDGRRVA